MQFLTHGATDMEPVFRTIGISRLRMTNDGEGVTTLAAGYGCPLRCRYCLNPQCFDPEAKTKTYTVPELLEAVKIDDLYFQATGGGIMFGGGEPLLYADFIHEFRKQCPPEWKISLETSLAVPAGSLKNVINDIDYFLIDIKDMDPGIYNRYTGYENGIVYENLQLLVSSGMADKICVRIPLIEGYNTEADRQKSSEILKKIGIKKQDLFTYNVKLALDKRQK